MIFRDLTAEMYLHSLQMFTACVTVVNEGGDSGRYGLRVTVT